MVVVGVSVLPLSTGGAVRVFYPAVSRTEKSAPWFRVSTAEVVDGYAHGILGSLSPKLRAPTALFRLASACLQLVARLVIGRPVLPGDASREAPPAPADALLLWSHGLMGNGDEHALMATSLASRDLVVGLVHHNDGSSAKCGQNYYRHPNYDDYDPGLRQRGAEFRAAELEEAHTLLERRFATTSAFVGGFSYGAATAALLASRRTYAGAVLVDGWFHIEIRGVEIDLPSQAFDRGIHVPTLFVGSEAFAKLPKLADATARLQAAASRLDAAVVVPQSTHATFMEASFWLPRRLAAAIGLASPDAATRYYDHIALVADFIQRHRPSR